MVGALLTSFGLLSLSSHTAVAAVDLQDFEGYADTAAAEADGWFTSSGEAAEPGWALKKLTATPSLALAGTRLLAGQRLVRTSPQTLTGQTTTVCVSG